MMQRRSLLKAIAGVLLAGLVHLLIPVKQLIHGTSRQVAPRHSPESSLLNTFRIRSCSSVLAVPSVRK
jgi:hypothetical protein